MQAERNASGPTWVAVGIRGHCTGMDDLFRFVDHLALILHPRFVQVVRQSSAIELLQEPKYRTPRPD